MENSIMTIAGKIPANFTFKSKALNVAANQIAEALSEDVAAVRGAVDTREQVKREIGVILADAKKNEAYKEDGFKDIADFAERTFSISAATVSQMIHFAERYVATDNKALLELAKSQTVSNLYELRGMEPDEISAAVESGEIGPKTAQRKLREVNAEVKAKRKGGKTKVLPDFVVDMTMVIAGAVSTKHIDRTPLEAVALPTSGAQSTKVFKFDNGAEYRVTVDESGNMMLVKATKYITPVAKTKAERKAGPVKKYSRAELEAMLAALDEAEEEEEG